jgi:hypothetical protein
MIQRLRARFAYPHDVVWYLITGAVLAEEFVRERLPHRSRP